jgi:hypothetical protein
MQPTSQQDTPATRIEGMLLDIQRRLDHQAIVIAHLQDELAASHRRDDWYHVQFGQMARILARDIRELRATLICSLINDGPVSTTALQSLLRTAEEDGIPTTATPRPQRN